jgi:hypothetical protein
MTLFTKPERVWCIFIEIEQNKIIVLFFLGNNYRRIDDP